MNASNKHFCPYSKLHYSVASISMAFFKLSIVALTLSSMSESTFLFFFFCLETSSTSLSDSSTLLERLLLLELVPCILSPSHHRTKRSDLQMPAHTSRRSSALLILTTEYCCDNNQHQIHPAARHPVGL